MKVSGFLLFILIFSSFFGSRCEATVYHSNGSAANVQQIHNTQAVDGDTITLPAGTFVWTGMVIITKSITIQGQTTVNSDTGVCDDRTILQDNLPTSAGYDFFICTVNTGQSLRITGITFTNAPGHAQTLNDVLKVSGNSTSVRLDHLHLTNIGSLHGIVIAGTIRGVADHIVEDNLPRQRCQNRADNGGLYGDENWAQPAGYGGPDFFFFEDWYINNTQNGVFSASGGIDSHNGGKYVLRHSHLFNAEILNHGTEGGRGRSGRAVELYNNDYHWSLPGVTMDGIRGGTMIAHYNTFDGGRPRGYGLQTYRSLHTYDTFFGATGKNDWDYNVTESDGVTHIDGHTSYLFDSGTVTSASGVDPVTVTVTGKTWTTNQWVSYAFSRPSDGANYYIQSNTSNTLTVRQWAPGDAHWAAGQGYEIRRVLRAIDQPGSGAGDLLGANLTPRWLNQVREGCYSWNNTYTPDGSHINFALAVNAGLGPGLVQGLDYFNNTPLPGYTPYTYPHPLVAGAGRAVITDFNSDGHPDYVLSNPNTHQTAIWYLNNNIYQDGALGPSIRAGWSLDGVADFNRDLHPDYALFNSTTDQTAIWYMSGPTRIASAYGPTLPGGWDLVATADFNGNGYPDYVLYNASTRQTAIWYLNNNVFVRGAFGPTLPVNWRLVGVADFDRDGHRDYVLFNSITHRTAIWYLSGRTLVRGAYGPSIPSGWALAATADFNGDGRPDYVLYNGGTRQTAIWYLNDNVYVSAAFGPTLPAGWSLFLQ